MTQTASDCVYSGQAKGRAPRRMTASAQSPEGLRGEGGLSAHLSVRRSMEFVLFAIVAGGYWTIHYVGLLVREVARYVKAKQR